jgi:hypothetical protein
LRFDKRITFVQLQEGGYNPITGGHGEAREIPKTVPCNLSPLGIERTNEFFGQIDRKITVARLQHVYSKPFDFVRIEGQKYNVKRQSDYRKGVFYLEGVASNG